MHLIGMAFPADSFLQLRDKTAGGQTCRSTSTGNKTAITNRAECIRQELDMLKLVTGGGLMPNSLPHSYGFESLKSGVRYRGADIFIYPERTRKQVRVAPQYVKTMVDMAISQLGRLGIKLPEEKRELS
ncbi:ATPase [Phytophthora palmivora]|uniref:ATPase n=1 Tax=Phytophthora palmivora TaxID=4796 RepID=A0A2P4XJT8_9STRA|nr:ATPase [Phytophthora palmivora]